MRNAPRALWRGWLVVARKIGRFQSFLILSLVYFVFIAPFALAVRFFSDPLIRHGHSSWQWLRPGIGSASSLDIMRRQSWGAQT